MQSTNFVVSADLVQCSICLDTYTRPKQIPCGHTYCTPCLESLLAGKQVFTCPDCRVKHAVPPTGIAGFRENYTVNNLLDLMTVKQVVECGDCGTEATGLKCGHCETDVCKGCHQKHLSLSSEIATILTQMKDGFKAQRPKSPRRRTIATLKLEQMKEQRQKMNEHFDMEVTKLAQHRQLLDDYFDMLINFHTCKVSESDRLPTCITELSDEITRCQSVQSLEDLKLRLADVKATSTMMESDGEFKFESKGIEPDEFARIEFGQNIVKMRPSDRVVADRMKPEPSRKGSSTPSTDPGIEGAGRDQSPRPAQQRVKKSVPKSSFGKGLKFR